MVTSAGNRCCKKWCLSSALHAAASVLPGQSRTLPWVSAEPEQGISQGQLARNSDKILTENPNTIFVQYCSMLHSLYFNPLPNTYHNTGNTKIRQSHPKSMIRPLPSAISKSDLLRLPTWIPKLWWGWSRLEESNNLMYGFGFRWFLCYFGFWWAPKFAQCSARCLVSLACDQHRLKYWP